MVGATARAGTVREVTAKKEKKSGDHRVGIPSDRWRVEGVSGTGM